MDKNFYELEKKIAMLTGRVFSLEEEVKALRKQISSQQTSPQSQPVVQSQPVAQPKAVSQAQTTMQSQAIPQPQVVSQASQPATPQPARPQVQVPYQAQPNVAQTTPAGFKNAPQKSMESRIGKNLMGVLASILILFSIILFGGLLYPFISDALKVVVMYLVSAGLTTVGIMKMRKNDKYNTLFTAISACGISAVYVSTLITYFGYHMISEYLLLLIIAIWLISTGILSKLKSPIFTYICNIGLIIASFLAMLQWNENVAGILFYFLGIIALFAFNFKRDFNKDIYYFMQIPIMSVIFSCCYLDKYCNGAALTILAMINVIALVIPNLIYRIEDKNYVWILVNTIMTFLSSIISVIMLAAVWNEHNAAVRLVFFLITILIVALYYVLYAMPKDNKHRSIFYVVYYMALAITPFTYYAGGVRDYIGWFPMFAVLIALGIFKNNKHFRYSGYGIMLLSLLVHPLSFELAYGIVIVSLIALTVYLSKNYCVIDKYILTPIALLGIALLLVEGFNFNVVLLCYILMLFIFNTKLFINNPSTGEKEKVSEILGNIYTACITLIMPMYIGNCDIGFTLKREGELVFATSSTVAVVVFTLLFVGVLAIRIMSLYRKDDLYSRIFLSVTALLCLVTITDGAGRYCILAAISALIMIVLLIQLSRKYRIYDKYVITGIAVVFILNLFRYTNLPIPFIFLAALSMFMNTKIYRIDPLTRLEEKTSLIVGYVMNAIMMFVGLVCILAYENPMEFMDTEILSPVITIIIISLLTIALFMVNTKKALYSGISKDLSGVYICTKYTVLIIAILYRLEAASYVFSMAGLILAIVFIVAGFGFRLKAFRIYGLILTLLSVLKLILFDIEYSSDIMRPLGIFISGILCFVISFIYSKIEKQISDKDNN